jgi:hypothetical protein
VGLLIAHGPIVLDLILRRLKSAPAVVKNFATLEIAVLLVVLVMPKDVKSVA